jgi:hypothetical protein
MSYGGLLRDCIGMPWLVPLERQGQVVSRASTFGKPESERELLLLICLLRKIGNGLFGKVVGGKANHNLILARVRSIRRYHV